jgi:hypothetical protein
MAAKIFMVLASCWALFQLVFGVQLLRDPAKIGHLVPSAKRAGGKVDIAAARRAGLRSLFFGCILTASCVYGWVHYHL